MGNLPQPAAELEVEQLALGRLEDVGPPAEVDGGSTAASKGDHVAGLKVECRLGSTWEECPSRPRQRPLLPLHLQASTTRVLLLNRGTHNLVQGAAPKQYQVLTQHRTEPLTEEQHLLIGVGVVGAILREVVELLAILIYTTQALLQVQEHLKLASHQARGDVVSTESCVELSQQHLVAILKSSGEVSPPSTHGPTKLLGHEQSLLELSAVQKSKLGLNVAEPAIHLQRISRLGERRSVHHQKVGIGGLHPWLPMGRAHLTLHEVLHQHSHELVLCGQQLLDDHGRRRWWWQQWWWRRRWRHRGSL
jgi:hypothetical protein